jgi:hypothetical protein
METVGEALEPGVGQRGRGALRQAAEGEEGHRSGAEVEGLT